MINESKQSLLARGLQLMERFCDANKLAVPRIEYPDPARWPFGVCAYYRKDVITINVTKCAAIGIAGMAWSFPGYSVDRTPYGVIQHELGHHADVVKSSKVYRYYGDFSIGMRAYCKETPLTSYCPDDAEWFAEMFRLFVTNPDLLRLLKPRTHAAMLEHFVPVFSDSWAARLQGAPDRTIVAAQRKIKPLPIPQ